MIENIKINIRHKKLRKILFWIVLGIAFLFFTIGIIKIATPKPGYFVIDAAGDSEFSSYNRDFELNIYLDGNTKSINTTRKALESYYTDILKTYAISYNSLYDTDKYVGPGYISTHLNQDIELNKDLYNDLKDAYNKTLNSNNYSIFASPMYMLWDHIAFDYQNGIFESDPLINPEALEELSELANLINDLDNFNLSFNDDTHSVNFSISETYSNFINEHHLNTYPLISFNKLYNAYVLKNVSKLLKDLGFTNFYLRGSDGYIITVGSMHNLIINTLSPNKTTLYSFELNGNLNVGCIYKYQTGSYVDVYTVSKDSRTYYRSSNINIHTGLPNDYLINVSVSSEDILTTAFIINELNSIDNDIDLNVFIANNTAEYIYVTHDEQNKIYTANINGIKNINTSTDYTIING